MGRNDVGVADLSGTVIAQIDAAIANLAPGVNYVIGTITPGATETTGTTPLNLILAANAAIKVKYGTHVADVYTALTTAGTPSTDGAIPAKYRASGDAIHLNDLGYNIACATFQATLVALGA